MGRRALRSTSPPSVDQRPAEIASSAAILGHPLRSRVAAARLGADAGEPRWVGDMVLAGGATAVVALRAGVHVRVAAERLGRAEFKTEE